MIVSQILHRTYILILRITYCLPDIQIWLGILCFIWQPQTSSVLHYCTCSRFLGFLSRIVRCVVNCEWERGDRRCKAAVLFRTFSLARIPTGPTGFSSFTSPLSCQWVDTPARGCVQATWTLKKHGTVASPVGCWPLTPGLVLQAWLILTQHSTAFLSDVSFSIVFTWLIK